MNNFPFEPRVTKFSKKNALCCAMASNIAYESEQDIQEQVENWGFEKFKFFDLEGTQAFIAATEQFILVSFRGTEGSKLQDLLSDANLIKTPGPSGNVHQGFLKALNQIMEGIHWTIREYKSEYAKRAAVDPGKLLPSLWFTGHSLGAGLATLAVAKMRIEKEEHEEPIHGLYTFGSPRVGDREFSEKFNGNFKNQAFRIVNNNDMVTRVPIKEHGYRHVGQFWYITSDGKLDDDIGSWELKFDRLRGRIDDFGEIGSDGLKDHFMKNGYIASLTKIVGNSG